MFRLERRYSVTRAHLFECTSMVAVIVAGFIPSSINRRSIERRITVWNFSNGGIAISGLLLTLVVGLSVVILDQAFVMFE